MILENLPQVRIQLLDGNLGVTKATSGPVVIVIGTASQGRSHYIVPVNSVGMASQYFGYDGTLVRGIIEAADAGAKNIYAYRIGGTAAKVTNIGNCPIVLNRGITIETVDKDDRAGEDYYVTWIDADERLIIWDLDGNVVYDNNPGGIMIDTGRVLVYGNTNGTSGPSFGTLSQGILLSQLDKDVSGGVDCVEYTAGTDGLGMTRRELYEALNLAYSELVTSRLDFVIPMDTYLDDLNLADDATLIGSGLDYLGWFRKTEVDGEVVYTWSDAITKPNGFHEVNFAYQLANFCYTAAVNTRAPVGFIGCRPPGYLENQGSIGWDKSPGAIARWLGEWPELDPFTKEIIANGSGLKGNKFMGGTTENDPGFYASDSEYLDGSVLYDDLDNAIQIGKYIQVAPTWHQMRNSFDQIAGTGYGYVTSDAPSAAGQMARTRVGEAPLYDQVSKAMKEFFFVPKTKLNSIIMPQEQVGRCYFAAFGFEEGRGIVCFDSPSAATGDSDYRRLSTTRIAIYASEAARDVLREFIGKGYTDALRTAAEAAVNKVLGQLKSESVIQNGRATVSSPVDGQILGYMDCDIDIVPAFEVRWININLGLMRELGL